MLLQTLAIEIQNDTQFIYLFKVDDKVFSVWPGEKVLVKDSLVFVKKLEGDYIKSLGWALAKEKISQLDYLDPCLLNNTADTLLINQHRFSFLINPGQELCRPELFINSRLLINLEINAIVKGRISEPNFIVFKASPDLKINIAPF